jgi:hypothetical protein
VKHAPCGKRYAGQMPEVDDFLEALAELLQTIPEDRRSAFLRAGGALCRRQRYDDRCLDFEAFVRSFQALIVRFAAADVTRERIADRDERLSRGDHANTTA